jgi:hypothetical protein
MNKKNSDNIITAASQLVGANPLQDGGMSLRFHTQELSPEAKVLVMEKFQKTGWVLFSQDKIQTEDIPKDNTSYEDKTPSQRQRGVMFVYWDKFKKIKNLDDDFNVFYNKAIEANINIYKSKIDEY